MFDYITFTDIKMFCDIWLKAEEKTDENSIYSNEIVTFKLAIHNEMTAYVCVMRSDGNVITFMIERQMVDDSFIPDSILADLICRQMRRL